MPLETAYHSIRQLLQQANCEHFLEPFEHVEAVHRLRHQYRPTGPIKLVVIGESHVRRFLKPGFIYDPTYYTPWWRDLLAPAFNFSHPTNAEERRTYLQKLQKAGFWLVDVSVIALSGYQTIHASWPKRPLDGLLEPILHASWQNYTASEIAACGSRAFCYFTRVASVLPEHILTQGVPLKFNSPRPPQGLRYRDPAYPYGTARFAKVVQSLGLREHLEE